MFRKSQKLHQVKKGVFPNPSVFQCTAYLVMEEKKPFHFFSRSRSQFLHAVTPAHATRGSKTEGGGKREKWANGEGIGEVRLQKKWAFFPSIPHASLACFYCTWYILAKKRYTRGSPTLAPILLFSLISGMFGT